MANLKLGSTGDGVIKLQNDLYQIAYTYNLLGVDPQVSIDLAGGGNVGIFDDKLQTAVVNFQRIAGLTVDGIVGPNTQAAIQKYLSGGSSSVSTSVSAEKASSIFPSSANVPSTGGLFGNVDWKTVGIAMAIGIAVLVLIFKDGGDE